MCGAVSFTVTEVPSEFGACHCEMCRRWTGSALLGVTVRAKNVTWQGEAHIKTLQSSDWAERAWCQRCGSPLYYHATIEGPMSETLQIPIGLLDDPSGLTMTQEIFIDCKPDGFAYTGDHSRSTRAEVFAKYGIKSD